MLVVPWFNKPSMVEIMISLVFIINKEDNTAGGKQLPINPRVSLPKMYQLNCLII